MCQNWAILVRPFLLSLSLSHGVIRLTYTKTASKVFSCNFLFLRTHTENTTVPPCTIFVLQTEQIMSFLYFCWDDPRFEDSKSPLNKSKHVNYFFNDCDWAKTFSDLNPICWYFIWENEVRKNCVYFSYRSRQIRVPNIQQVVVPDVIQPADLHRELFFYCTHQVFPTFCVN